MKKFVVLILVLALIFGGFYFILTRESTSAETSTLYDNGALVYQGDLMPKEESTVIDGQVYLSYDFIKEHIDNDISYDEVDQIVIITDKENVRRYTIDSLEGTVNDVAVNLRAPITRVNGKIMLPIESFVYDYPIVVRYNSEEKVITVDSSEYENMTAKVTVNTTNLREEASNSSPIVKILNKDNVVTVYGETKEWYKVREENGRVGYLPKNHLELDYTFDGFTKEIKKEEARVKRDEKINLVWDYTAVKNDPLKKDLELPGVNVMSPTWFSLKEDLTIENRGNLAYTDSVHERGMEVWAMFDNNFKTAVAEKGLQRSSTRQRLIKELLEMCKELNVDGINVDFEEINVATRDNYTQFIRELYPIFSAEGLVVSVDVVPRIFTDERDNYDRKGLAEAADYIMLMTYDQYWSSSPEAGSVAEYSWVENNLNSLFRDIPMEKFIYTVPLYTRVWLENKNGGLESQTVSMEVANKFVTENNVDLEWDEKAKQYVGKKDLGDRIGYVWIEDAKSIREKASLIQKYDMAGIASWRLGYETQDIFPAINDTLH